MLSTGAMNRSSARGCAPPTLPSCATRCGRRRASYAPTLPTWTRARRPRLATWRTNCKRRRWWEAGRKRWRSYARLIYATLAEADLSGANLTRAGLIGANLTRADLSGANLTRADLSGANLTRASLFGADLIFAKLNDADLTGADLIGADLSYADLSGANLFGADLSDGGGWSTVTLKGVRGCDTATEPRPLLPGC